MVLLSKFDLFDDVVECLVELCVCLLGIMLIYVLNGKSCDSVELLLLYLKLGDSVVLVGFLGVGKFMFINILFGIDKLVIGVVCVYDSCGCYIIIYCVLL